MSVPGTTSSITVYGDFNCPWSYLAWRRSEILASDGVDVDWRAVEHDPWHHLTPADIAERYRAAHQEMGKVAEHLLPGEHLPHVSHGFMPFSAAATAAYAEATVAGVPAGARRALFEGFWLHGLDLNDGRAVRHVLADVVRGQTSPSELISLWGYTVDVTGGAITSAGWSRVRDWRADWKQLGEEVVPTAVLHSGESLHGEEAVDRLGEELTARGLTEFDVARTERPVAGAA